MPTLTSINGDDEDVCIASEDVYRNRVNKNRRIYHELGLDDVPSDITSGDTPSSCLFIHIAVYCYVNPNESE